jgi:Predicted acyltransferases
MPNPRSEGGHYEWLDFLRFVAAMLVVLAHVRGTVFQEYGVLNPENRNILVALFYAFARLGHEAVVVFFVLSGYLVGGKALERIANDSFIPTDFAIDRITRIWIPLVPALLLSGLLTRETNDISTWIGNLLGLQGTLVSPLGENGPLWSLAYEIWFYVLTYAIGKQAGRKHIDLLALLLIGVTALIFTRLEVQYLACWLIGAAFYLRPHRFTKLRGLCFSGLLCAGAIAGLQLTGNGFMSKVSGFEALRPSLEILLAVGTGIGCVTLVTLKSSRISTLAPPLAAFSYTLYLTHNPLLIALRQSGWERIPPAGLKAAMIYSLAVATCMLVAWLNYLIFERNTSSVRRWMKAWTLPVGPRTLMKRPQHTHGEMAPDESDSSCPGHRMVSDVVSLSEGKGKTS